MCWRPPPPRVHPLSVAPCPSEDDADDDAMAPEEAVCVALANWRALVLEADRIQEAGFFSPALDATARRAMREFANAHWERSGPRLQLLEGFLRNKLRERPHAYASHPDAQFFVMAACRRGNPALRHLYRDRVMLSRRDSDSL